MSTSFISRRTSNQRLGAAGRCLLAEEEALEALIMLVSREEPLTLSTWFGWGSATSTSSCSPSSLSILNFSRSSAIS